VTGRGATLPALLTSVAMMLLLVAACGGSPGHAVSNPNEKMPTESQKAYDPRIKPSDFTTKIDNKYFPLKPGTTFVYKGKFKGAAERDEMAVTHDTRRVMGVECLVASDRVTEDGKLIEQTYDWYAQDKEGNVWYFGEHVTEFKNGKVAGHEGSWKSGGTGQGPGLPCWQTPG
jgi:hypothetical protein